MKVFVIKTVKLIATERYYGDITLRTGDYKSMSDIPDGALMAGWTPKEGE
jgi:hypothetical protein